MTQQDGLLQFGEILFTYKSIDPEKSLAGIIMKKYEDAVLRLVNIEFNSGVPQGDRMRYAFEAILRKLGITPAVRKVGDRYIIH